jgi:hypothetical protein
MGDGVPGALLHRHVAHFLNCGWQPLRAASRRLTGARASRPATRREVVRAGNGKKGTGVLEGENATEPELEALRDR